MVIQNRIGLTSIKKAAKGKKSLQDSLGATQHRLKKNFGNIFVRDNLGINSIVKQLYLGILQTFGVHKSKLLLKFDGKIHEKQREYDAERDTRLEQRGIKTIRFTASEIFEKIDSVVAKIQNELDSK
ncbi:MAG: DUF559 domain-containing protein [Limnothrix sp. RL_2_0]|nr:DUF559 domain-containing protein [Limnothrix sp. RL_2_0]